MPERMVGPIWIAEEGHGPPILLAPGGGGLGDYLEPVSRELESVATVIRIEPRGCGRSARDGRYDLETTLSDFDAVRTELGFERWIVGGHSHGAFYALAYALAYPDRVAGIVHMAGTGLQRDRSWSETYHAGVDAGLGKEVPEELWVYNPEAHAAANRDYQAYVRRPTLWRDVSRLKISFLAVYGERDIRPMWPVEQIVALLPNARLEVIPDAPHDFWYTHPEALGAILRQFLGEVERTRL
jgi:proline iminopeptidase